MPPMAGQSTSSTVSEVLFSTDERNSTVSGPTRTRKRKVMSNVPSLVVRPDHSSVASVPSEPTCMLAKSLPAPVHIMAPSVRKWKQKPEVFAEARFRDQIDVKARGGVR